MLCCSVCFVWFGKRPPHTPAHSLRPHFVCENIELVQRQHSQCQDVVAQHHSPNCFQETPRAIRIGCGPKQQPQSPLDATLLADMACHHAPHTLTSNSKTHYFFSWHPSPAPRRTPIPPQQNKTRTGANLVDSIPRLIPLMSMSPSLPLCRETQQARILHHTPPCGLACHARPTRTVASSEPHTVQPPLWCCAHRFLLGTT